MEISLSRVKLHQRSRRMETRFYRWEALLQSADGDMTLAKDFDADFL